MARRWFDAHLDLACIAENGRDMTAPLDRCGGPKDPAVTLPSMLEGGVGACLATIFTEPNGDDAVAYPSGNALAAHACGLRQLAAYERWTSSGLMAPMRSTPPAPGHTSRTPSAAQPIRFGILIEGADPVLSPQELPWWVQRGALAVGLAWARPSRYSGGNSTPSLGLTDLGREMIDAIDRLGVVHDLSHLSDSAMDELLSRAKGRVIASHSNCRALLDHSNQRHLRDESIKEIARRGGIIGLNLFGKFLSPPGREPPVSTIQDAVAHIERICNLVGDRRSVGLGTDMDGGFGAGDLPTGIRRPADLEKLAHALLAAGWQEAEVDDFAWGNWARFWGLSTSGASIRTSH